jgi:mRNA-degrading endonuclease toxin of MazEF toxin-antitoxin module
MRQQILEAQFPAIFQVDDARAVRSGDFERRLCPRTKARIVARVTEHLHEVTEIRQVRRKRRARENLRQVELVAPISDGPCVPIGVVPLSSSPRPLPPLIVSVPTARLPTSTALCGQLGTIDKRRIVGGSIGRLSAEDLDTVECGVRQFYGL